MSFKRAVYHDLVSGQEPSDEELNSLMVEFREVESDENVLVYEFPSVAELGEVVARARVYSGDWYHSRVLLPVREEITDLSDEYLALYDEVKRLGETSGMYISWEQKNVPEGFGDLFR